MIRKSYAVRFVTLLAACYASLGVVAWAQAKTPTAIGIFESSGDIGDTPRKGTVEYSRTADTYTVTGGGANIWAKADAFQFVWKQVSGNFALTADVHFLGTGTVSHRKAVLMVRQSLASDSAYADVALHGDGLTALQFRPTVGEGTDEIRSLENAPVRIRIERRGNSFTMLTGQPNGKLTQSDLASVVLDGPVYVGLGVCSHDPNVLETAVFENVKLETFPTEIKHSTRIRSNISIYDLRDKSVHVVYTADKLIEAPNWSSDGKYLLANSDGLLFRLALDGTGPVSPEKLSLDSTYKCNNDHGLSLDGKALAFSASFAPSHESQVFIADANGSHPRLLTPKMPSYFHGFSPDGRWLAFVGKRSDKFSIYRVPAAGGEEQRLTSNATYDDGPDYSPDGKWIYINSNRSGSWDIWRFPAEGAGASDSKAEQITNDELEDWFPHPSPDGKWLVFLSFPKGTEGHNDKLNVQLRLMPAEKAKAKPGAITVLTEFFGGQGTINVNSWSPDSTRFAFVGYELLPEK